LLLGNAHVPEVVYTLPPIDYVHDSQSATEVVFIRALMFLSFCYAPK